MLKQCPECGSDKIICESIEVIKKSASLGAKIVNTAAKLTSFGTGIPRGQVVYQCKKCGKSGTIFVN